MGDTDNQNNELVVAEFVQDATVADAKPSQPLEVALQ